MVAVFESVFRLCPAESVTENEGALLKAMVKVASVCLCLPLSVSVCLCLSPFSAAGLCFCLCQPLGRKPQGLWAQLRASLLP